MRNSILFYSDLNMLQNNPIKNLEIVNNNPRIAQQNKVDPIGESAKPVFVK